MNIVAIMGGHRPIEGCPEPRTGRGKRAAAILSSGIVPPLLRRFCDDATPLIRDLCKSVLNARLVGTLHAGAVERKGVDRYADKARQLGRRLAYD